MKLQLYLFIVGVFFSSPVFAENSLSAHLHGHVELNVAADGKTLFVEVYSPSQSFLGFEHRPETDQQKSLWSAVKNQWENKTSELFQIDPSLACKVTQAHMNMHFEEEEHHHHDDANKEYEEKSNHETEHHGHDKYEPLKGEHSEIKAEAIYMCKKEIKDSQLVVKLFKYFPEIEEVEVQALPNSGTPYSKMLRKNNAIMDF
jgi:hypothetical protein